MNKTLLIILLALCFVTRHVIACENPQVVAMGIIKDKNFDGLSIYSEHLYSFNGMLCGKVKIIKGYKIDDVFHKIAMVEYFDEYGQLKLRENYTHALGEKHESIYIKVLHKDGRTSWELAFSTIDQLNKEETFLENPKPILGYLKWFVSHAEIQNKALKQTLIQSTKSGIQ